MERVLQDLKYSLRMLRQQRAFTFAAIAALALGIGATTAVFSVVNAILLRPFPYPDPDRIVMFMNTSPNGSGGGRVAREIRALGDSDRRDSGCRRHFATSPSTTPAATPPSKCTSGNVSENFFRLWGARTAVGRTFSTEEDRPNGPKVAVLSYGWWTRRFASDPTSSARRSR